MRKRRKPVHWLLNLLVLLVLSICLFPFFIMLTTSLKTSLASVAYPPELWPSQITFEHFKNIMNPLIFPFWRYFGNSFFIGFFTASITVFVCSLGAYSMARLNFFGKRFIQNGTLVVYMFSGVLLVVPLFRIMGNLHLIDNKFSVVIACLVSCLPAGLSMLTAYFKSIPDSIEESAMMDGLNRVQVIFRIIMPLSVPALMSVFAYVFMIAWNNFLFSTTFLSSPANLTLIVGMRTLFSSQDYVWGRMMAASLLTAIPVILIFASIERFITGGLTAGGVKG